MKCVYLCDIIKIMARKRKVKSTANIRLLLDGDALKYVDNESDRLRNEDRPLSQERIIKRGLAGLYQQKYAKK